MSGLRPGRRRFLFLQGLPGFFFSRLGAALMSRGHEVRRINFNMGDRLFWRLPGATDYRGGEAGWPAFLSERLDRWKPTDIVLFGDCRPLHRAAVALAEAQGIDVHVAEEGYLRPNWVTLEPGGVNGHSFLSRDPDWYLDAARETAPWTGGVPVLQSFADRAREDVIYNIAAVAGAWAYPGYRTHRTEHPLREYMSWIARLSRRKAVERRARQGFEALRAEGHPYYLFPLQLDGDYQLREHSPFAGMGPAIDAVIASFASHAPPDARLLVKEHPLNSGLLEWSGHVAAEAAKRGAAGRVSFVDGGVLELMLERAAGVVTVNSTVGFLALGFGVPTIAVGDAIYGIPKLTFQGELDGFWTQAQRPEPPGVRRLPARRGPAHPAERRLLQRAGHRAGGRRRRGAARRSPPATFPPAGCARPPGALAPRPRSPRFRAHRPRAHRPRAPRLRRLRPRDLAPRDGGPPRPPPPSPVRATCHTSRPVKSSPEAGGKARAAAGVRGAQARGGRAKPARPQSAVDDLSPSGRS